MAERTSKMSLNHFFTDDRSASEEMRVLAHHPLDYCIDTFPPSFDYQPTPDGSHLPVPPRNLRMGYNPPTDAEYLASGQHDHDLIKALVLEHAGTTRIDSIVDFGCGAGRVLRHFHEEHKHDACDLIGFDLQALSIEWMRRNFPKEFCVSTCTAIPHLPLPDNSVDVIYGMSVFTHIKFLWDMWLLELKRILKPGGLLIQTICTEAAWRYCHTRWSDPSVGSAGYSPRIERTPEMDVEFVYSGNLAVGHVFWQRNVAQTFWSRYFDVVALLPPPKKYIDWQDWIVCKKPAAENAAR